MGQVRRAFDAALQQRQTFLESSPRRQVDSFYGTEQVLDFRTPNNGPSTTTPALDGIASVQHRPAPVEVHCSVPWTPRGNELLGEIRSDAYPATRQPPTEPPLLASARARRRQARSQDIHMFRDDDNNQQRVLRAYGVSLNEGTEVVPPIPELILPPDQSRHPHDPALDPGAPVFIPRTRFGTAAGSSESTQLQLGATDTTNLRIRSSSEQNADLPTRRVHRSQRRDITFGSVVDDELDGIERRLRRRSRTADQNIALSHVTPTIERYPLMRSALDDYARPYSGSLTHDGLIYVPVDHRDQALSSQHDSRISSTQEQSRLRVRNELTVGNNARGEDGSSTRSVSPAIPMGSRSTPNLLEYRGPTPRFTVRGSSLPWNRVDPCTPNYSRVPSMVSAASGISGGQEASRQSSIEGLLDAATEFLRMRNSPLDDLTERLSRMAPSRPRSVGRSWERPPRPRVSLLAGDPFRPDPPSDSASSTYMTVIEPALPAILPINAEEPDAAPEDIVALSLALPPSSPFPSSSHLLPSTPSLHFSEPRSPQSVVDDAHAATSPESSIKRKPVPSSTTTPKVPVYDDSKVPDMQPQTPADVCGSKRRAKTRSDTAMQQAPIFVGRTMIRSPPAIPERHPHRNTYPATTSTQSSVSSAISTAAPSATATMANMPETTRRARNSRRGRGQRGSEQLENDLDAHLQGLEDDRRTWINRREGGNMEVTPPREGRFERYLS